MKVLSKLICALLFFVSTAGAQTVDEVIAKHIEAMGGNAKLAALKTMKITSSIDMMGMKMPVVSTIVDGKASRTEVTFQGMTEIMVSEGESGWYISPFQGKKEPEKANEEMIKEAKEERDLSGALYNYKGKGNKVELTGKEELEGTDVYKLKITRPTGDVSYQFIDASNYLLLKETSKQKFQDKEVESERLLSNYKMIDGINFPFTVEVRKVGESTGQIMTVDNVEMNPNVDDSIFKMPATATK
jgi:hypothetical protein